VDRRAVDPFKVAPDETELGNVYSFSATLRLQRLVAVPIDAAGAAFLDRVQSSAMRLAARM
jgi:hypothetical protein